MAFAKENPGAVSIGTTGVGTDEHLAMLQLEESAGVDMTAVPFGGANESKTALLGGHVTVIGLKVGEVAGSEPGQFKGLAQFTEERSILAPDLPTAKEQGFDVLMSSERGIAAPCAVPEEVRARLAEAVDKAVANPEFQEKAKQQGLALSYQSGADWAAAMPERLARYEEIIKMVKEGQ